MSEKRPRGRPPGTRNANRKDYRRVAVRLSSDVHAILDSIQPSYGSFTSALEHMVRLGHERGRELGLFRDA